MKRTLHDLASLAARMGVGGIFFANGWHKLEAGLTATGADFAKLGAPLPGFWAAAAMLIELIGGTLLIAGLAVPAVGLLLFAEALAVFILTAGDTGLPLTGGDIELIVALGAASVLLAVGGAGRISVDHMVVIKRREAEAAEDFAAEAEADAVIAALREPRTPAPAERSTAERHATGPTDRGEPGTAGKPKGPSVEPASRKGAGAKGPVTFPASSSPAPASTQAPASTPASASSDDKDGTAANTAGNTAANRAANTAANTVPKGRLRRTKRDETTESRSEPPSRPAEPGDTLVAGRRTPAEPD
ncbi:DoxX family protein [Planotetraspora sp. A-T 1434]|uniref:DoxX family protein n=1 Tax=Planotetraspora sp. A-T 1434 TaxID=2979219 RepID=UPI0021C17347|nr:DoxX family protein [Planotetraspora sp. A-T 1434]MCT9931107.1 DoxX family protein [Planotetraspora sp. A-T 1434]